MRDETTQTAGATSRLARLDDLDDYQVADGDPDVRGWDVRIADRRKVGEVAGLLVDLGTMTVRYLDLELDRKAFHLDRPRHVLIPVGSARLDDDRDELLLEVPNLTLLMALPEYRRGPLSRADEIELLRRVDERHQAAGDGSDLYDHAYYDLSRFFGVRRAGREDAAYLVHWRAASGAEPGYARPGDAEVRRPVETERGPGAPPAVREGAPDRRAEEPPGGRR